MAKRRANISNKSAGNAVAMAATAEQITNKQAGSSAKAAEINAESDAAAIADAATKTGARTEEQEAKPDTQAEAAKAKAPEVLPDPKAEEEKPYIRVAAPAGPRRRAGFSFGPVPVDLKWSELGEDDFRRDEAIEILIADRELAIAFYDHEGAD